MRVVAHLLPALALLPALLSARALEPDSPADAEVADVDAPVAATQKHHHHHHRHHHKKHHHKKAKQAEDVPADDAKAPEPKATAAAKTVKAPATAKASAVPDLPISHVQKMGSVGSEKAIVAKMKAIEGKLAAKEKEQHSDEARRSLRVNGPLPADFNEKFAKAVAQATKCSPSEVKVVGALPAQAGIVQVLFEAPERIADETVDEASNPDSPLATGALQSFLTAKDDDDEEEEKKEEPAAPAVSGPRIDIDAAMPYGDLEPFGREDTAQELTEQAVTESNEMVDQLERAEVAEEKRAVFRALTRLRGAAVTSFDGIARSQTGNIDEYNKVNKWRKTHPLHHLADEESDVSRWAFPDSADF